MTVEEALRERDEAVELLRATRERLGRKEFRRGNRCIAYAAIHEWLVHFDFVQRRRRR